MARLVSKLNSFLIITIMSMKYISVEEWSKKKMPKGHSGIFKKYIAFCSQSGCIAQSKHRSGRACDYLTV